ncbi:unnamed protein product [Dicrocoelium dendriticum]|nr:unnamed protein product [Dicrocoelium dendriticum]
MNDSKIQVGLKKLPIHLQSSQNRLLIKGGKIVNDDRAFYADVYIEDGIIKQVGTQLTIPGGVRVIDAVGKMVLPGGVDPHTHMQMSFMGCVSSDDFYTGTRAAIAGGTTTIIDFVCPTKGSSLLKAYDECREMADAKVCCDYALHVIIPHLDGTVTKEMATLVKDRGVNSFKVFLSYSDLMLEDDEVYRVFRLCKELGALSMVHAENGRLISILQDEIFASGIRGPEGHLYSHPEATEVEATSRAITLADAAACPLYVVHVMSAAAARIISDARHNGCVVIGEAVPSALATDGRHYLNSCWRHAAGHIVSPPLHPDPKNSLELMRCLGHGELEVTGSNHRVFRTEQRARGKDDFRKIPNGANGVEERMSVIWEKGVVIPLPLGPTSCPVPPVGSCSPPTNSPHPSPHPLRKPSPPPSKHRPPKRKHTLPPHPPSSPPPHRVLHPLPACTSARPARAPSPPPHPSPVRFRPPALLVPPPSVPLPRRHPRPSTHPRCPSSSPPYPFLAPYPTPLLQNPASASPPTRGPLSDRVSTNIPKYTPPAGPSLPPVFGQLTPAAATLPPLIFPVHPPGPRVRGPGGPSTTRRRP